MVAKFSARGQRPGYLPTEESYAARPFPTLHQAGALTLARQPRQRSVEAPSFVPSLAPAHEDSGRRLRMPGSRPHRHVHRGRSMRHAGNRRAEGDSTRHPFISCRRRAGRLVALAGLAGQRIMPRLIDQVRKSAQGRQAEPGGRIFNEPRRRQTHTRVPRRMTTLPRRGNGDDGMGPGTEVRLSDKSPSLFPSPTVCRRRSNPSC